MIAKTVSLGQLQLDLGVVSGHMEERRDLASQLASSVKG